MQARVSEGLQPRDAPVGEAALCLFRVQGGSTSRCGSS